MPTNFSLSTLRWYFTGLLATWVMFALYLSGSNKADSFLTLHPDSTTGLDGLMVYGTHLGDGLFTILILLIFLLRKQWATATLVALAYSISGLGTQLLKHLTALPRPLAFFQHQGVDIFVLPEVTVHMANSFPSGHAASAFALATSLVIHTRHKWLGIPLLVIAWMVAYSRVYLGQHFPEDILAGSLLGTGSALLARWLVLYLMARYPKLRNTILIPRL